MPFLTNNLSYFVTSRSEDEYARDEILYQDSRVPILFEADVFGDIDYWGLNQTEGFGIFRQISLDELPGPRDIVLYDALPNDLPRVAGSISSVMQTPLSHVNLRAIQNNSPNAFIRDPLAIDSIAALLDGPIYFKVEQSSYTIRAATTEEVNNWFDDLRPSEPQEPPLNLGYTEILPLTEIAFSMFDGFGAKCTNVATMGTFGFPVNTIPDGFGVPFYFYQEFMRFNGFFAEAEAMIAAPGFTDDRMEREEALRAFRTRIKDADMPTWMLDKLAEMHAGFPVGTSVRCRSSTNNEDLPGFNGAGLYDSKTQHPDEGHISKSIKQVYASLWNLRAYEEREYYRIDHFIASMGVLCHPNYSDEKVNGVGVSTDPLYGTENTFYLNSQLGEDLITNPASQSIPEEILLERTTVGPRGHILVQRSNLVGEGEDVLGGVYLDEMRDFLTIIHDEFAILYEAVGDPNFAMDIEYKVTVDDQLIIKQARPWVAYTTLEIEEEPEVDAGAINVFPNPATNSITVEYGAKDLKSIVVRDIMGRPVSLSKATDELNPRTSLPTAGLPRGTYLLTGTLNDGSIKYLGKFIKH